MTDIDLSRLAVDRGYWDGVHDAYVAYFKAPLNLICGIPRPTKQEREKGQEPGRIEQEWDGEGPPPVGVECRMTLGFVVYDRVKVTYMGEGVFCYLNMRTELEYTGALCDATFRPLKSQHERIVDGAISEIAALRQRLEQAEARVAELKRQYGVKA